MPKYQHGYRLPDSRTHKVQYKALQLRLSLNKHKLIKRIAKLHCKNNMNEVVRLAVDVLGCQLGYIETHEVSKARHAMKMLSEQLPDRDKVRSE